MDKLLDVVAVEEVCFQGLLRIEDALALRVISLKFAPDGRSIVLDLTMGNGLSATRRGAEAKKKCKLLRRQTKKTVSISTVICTGFYCGLH